MKRRFWLILLFGLAAFVVGCSAAQTDTPPAVSSSEDVQRIAPAEAKVLLDRGEATLYDTRSAESYQQQHAAGAISLPEDELAARFQELPDAEEMAIIFYCT